MNYLNTSSTTPTFSITTREITGIGFALEGLALSYNSTPSSTVADRLSHKGGGHNKFLESITVYQDITAARDWWSQFDTYRIGITKQSQSTMHTLTKKPLTQDNFAIRIKESYLDYINNLIEANEPISKIKKALPEAFLQRRFVCTNYLTLQKIYSQRHKHKLGEWKLYCSHLLTYPHPNWIGEGPCQ